LNGHEIRLAERLGSGEKRIESRARAPTVVEIVISIAHLAKRIAVVDILDVLVDSIYLARVRLDVQVRLRKSPGARILVFDRNEDPMAKALSRSDFLIQDLVVSLGSGSRGGTWMPGPDDETPPSPISPIASIFANLALIESVRATISEAVEANQFDDVASAFIADGTGGNAVIRAAIHEIGASVVASTAFAELFGGKVGLPDPDCGGTSLETIPPTLTPVVQTGLSVHRATELPRLKRQLAQATEYVEKSAAELAPQGAEVAVVREQLEGALKSLR
jgi:hypothetical protein